MINQIQTSGNPKYLSRQLNPLQFGYDIIKKNDFSDPNMVNWWYERPGPQPSKVINDYTNDM